MEMSPEAEIRNKSPVKESTNQNQFLSKVWSLPNRLKYILLIYKFSLSNVTPSRTLTNDSSKLNIQTPSLASNMISSNTFGWKFPPPQGIIDNCKFKVFILANAISPKRTFGSNIPTSSKSTSSDINMQARQIVCPNSTLQNAAQKKLSDKSTNPFLSNLKCHLMS